MKRGCSEPVGLRRTTASERRREASGIHGSTSIGGPSRWGRLVARRGVTGRALRRVPSTLGCCERHGRFTAIFEGLGFPRKTWNSMARRNKRWRYEYGRIGDCDLGLRWARLSEQIFRVVYKGIARNPSICFHSRLIDIYMSMVFLVEHAPEGRRGLMGALVAASCAIGTLLGSAVGAAFAASMSTATLDAWGWRIPFLLGLVVGIAGYILRRHVLETGVAEKRMRAPIVETLHDHGRVVAAFAGLSVFSSVTFYIGFVYMVSWLQIADGIPPSRALEINTFSMVVSLPVLIAAGWLSDRVGRKPLMLLASMGGVIGALPLFWLLNHPSELLAQLGQLGLVVLMGLYYGALPATLVEAAPPTVRCTTVALGYNLCLGLFGGLSPLVATWLVERTGDEIAPAFLIMAAAAVTFVTLFTLRETYRAPFGADPRTTAAK